MKHIPILFSAPMVRAILDGRKTQTRRIVKPQPPSSYRLVHMRTQDTDYNPITGVAGLYAGFDTRPDDDLSPLYYRSKYGQPGDRLWVKETFAFHPEVQGERIYRADRGGDYQGAAQGDFKWKPSIFMPREASRITLEITGVRVERLRDITESDAKAEGCCGVTSTHFGIPNYRHVWESINGPGSWEENPWVWVLTFQTKGGDSPATNSRGVSVSASRRLGRSGAKSHHAPAAVRWPINHFLACPL